MSVLNEILCGGFMMPNDDELYDETCVESTAPPSDAIGVAGIGNSVDGSLV